MKHLNAAMKRWRFAEDRLKAHRGALHHGNGWAFDKRRMIRAERHLSGALLLAEVLDATADASRVFLDVATILLPHGPAVFVARKWAEIATREGA